MARNRKDERIGFFSSQYALLNIGVDKKTCAQAIKSVNVDGQYNLYTAELEGTFLEDLSKKVENFDPKTFVELLQEASCLKEGDAPKMLDNVTRVDSSERALQVANDPKNEEDVTAIQDIMKQITSLRDRLNPLISKNASLSIALKNKKKKADEPAVAG